MGWLQGKVMSSNKEPLTEWQIVDNPSSPSLPEELLLCIFKHIAQDDHDVVDNVSCMLVCRLWYFLVTETRLLWTTISVTFDCYSEIPLLCDRVKACIKYSQNAMLDIVIQIDTLLDPEDDVEEDAEGNTSIASERIFKPYLEFMTVLKGEGGCHALRWRSFQLWIASGVSDKTAFYLLGSLKSEVPHLEDLGIHLGYSPNAEISWEMGQLFDILPGLTSLKTLAIDHRLILGIQSFRPSLIVQLTLIDTTSVREFLSIGSQFTVLQQLVVDMRDRNVISGRDVAIPSLTHLKVTGYSALEFISHLVTEKLVHLDMADADFSGSHLVGSNAYESITTLSWRSRDPTMMAGPACMYITLLAFILTQCTMLAEIQLWKKHQEVFMHAITKARKEGPVLKLLQRLKVYNSGWEFNERTLVEVVDMSIPGD